MSGLSPSGPAQPSKSDAYTTSSNPASNTPAESATAHAAPTDNPRQEIRKPGSHPGVEEATPSSLGRGVHGAPQTAKNQDGGPELEAEQMAAPGEGRVRDAVVGDNAKQGAAGAQEGLETDMDRKKAEQAPAREAIQSEREEKVDVGGILGQRGGPANPVD